MAARVVSINTSTEKGCAKSPLTEAALTAGVGIDGDAHAGGPRQVSLLAKESIDRGIASGVALKPGDFGENVTTEGADLASLGIGMRLALGDDVILQVSEIGKICESPCSIGQRLGDCVMPREGVFAKVVRGGMISVGDAIEPTCAKVGAVITCSDRCSSGERPDDSGPQLVGLLSELGVVVAEYSVLPDEEARLREKLEHLADDCAVDLVLTTGGTGFGPRDRTPEATLAVLESQAPGVSEAIRHEGMKHTAYACISRGVSGLRGRTLIINLPGSKRAVAESLDLLRAVLPHMLEALRAEIADCGTMRRRGLPRDTADVKKEDI